MACGAPVACSNAASLPEVAGDAALLFDPLDSDAIAASLGALLTDEGLRTALVARGFSHAAGFSWAACARRTLAAYEAALA
jgi:glycosyltransferase involved in cell wall biosynthesis